MLFDLRGRGRRRAVKVIYIFLAVLLGGGLVFFGIGGNTNGGLLDVFKNQSDSQVEQTQERRDKAADKTAAQPSNPAVWAGLAETEYQLAQVSKGFQVNQSTGQVTYSGSARSHLEAAKRAWEKHVQLAGDKPDLDRARQMANVFIGLDDYAGAVGTQELVMESLGDKAQFGDYGQLATYAYQAGQTRKGDLATEKAIELAPSKSQKDQLKTQLESIKAQAGAQAGQSTNPTPAPTATTGP